MMNLEGDPGAPTAFPISRSFNPPRFPQFHPWRAILLGGAGGRELLDPITLLLYFEESGVGEQPQTTIPRLPELLSVYQCQPGCESSLSSSREIQAFVTGSLSTLCSNFSVPNLCNSGGRASSKRGQATKLYRHGFKCQLFCILTRCKINKSKNSDSCCIPRA